MMSPAGDPFNVALIQRAAIDFYPPTINQANLLVEAGFRVVVLDGGQGPRPTALHSDVSLARPLESAGEGTTGVPKSAARRLLDIVRFLVAARAIESSTGASVLIGYDSPAIAAMAAARFRGFTVCHFHEYPEVPSNEGRKVDAQHRIARRYARSADLIVMPDRHRAEALEKEDGLTGPSLVVRNCPRRLTQLPAGRLRKALDGKRGKYTVLFQGAVSQSYYADRIVESMPWWPSESQLVFLGPVKAACERSLLGIARDVGMLERVVLLPRVPYSDLFGYTVDADLGLTMARPHSFNFAHTAGTSNKRYEFMACGIPQISNHGPGMYELIEANGVGLCVDPENPEEIGRRVAYLLGNETLRRKM
ncbi:MAG: glycosyltransferase, partial [Anaerolineae bacterium]|nr:glycosyltransferase [Anaerolineae bacterium]